MNAVNQWCKDKPPAIRMLARIIAFSAPDIRRTVDPNLANKLPATWQYPQNPAQWRAGYTSTRKIRAILFTMLFEGRERTGAKLYHGWNVAFARNANTRILASWKGLSVKRRTSAIRFGNWLCTIFEAALNHHIQTMLKPAQFTPLAAKTMRMVEMQFFVRVFIPCMLLYGQAPSRLLRSARLGDLKALKMLISVDPHMVNDPGIARLRYQWQNDPAKCYSLAQLNTALIPCPESQPSLWLIKARLGGLLLHLSNVLKPVNHDALGPHDIRDLFDATVQDTTMTPSDPALADIDDEAFRRRLRAYAKLWAKALGKSGTQHFYAAYR